MRIIATENKQHINSYAWVILLIIFFIQVTVNFSIFQIAGLAGSLIHDFQLSPTELAMVLSVPMLISAILGIPTGALADRFGVKRVVIIGLLITLFGSFARMSATDFQSLFLWMLLLGFGGAFVNSNAAKLLGAWFPPQRMGFAMGVYVSAAGVGITIALATSSFFSSVQTAFLVSAITFSFFTIMWIIFVKNKPEGAPDHPIMPIAKCLGVAARSKNVWVGGAAIFFMMGTYVTHTGFLANALAQAKGVAPSLAGLVASSLTFAFIFGGLFGPVVSGKVGLTKPFLAPTAILCAFSSYLSWTVPFGALTWVFLIITGILLGASVPMIMALPMSLPEIGPIYAGSAGGILSTFQMAGAFVISSYVIIPLAGENIDRLFLYVSIGYLLYGLITLFLPELGEKAKSKNICIEQQDR